MLPIRHGNMATISEMGPTITVGSAKAHGLKVKLVYRTEPLRTTRERDKVTQRMANILVHPALHCGNLASSGFVSESRPEDFLHTPMWTSI
jgi:hypothetical protein